jgi:murein DD-endopeptidase MepM/ murein hydrolase activator NlpD
MAGASFVRNGLAVLMLAGFACGDGFPQDLSTSTPSERDRFRWPLRGAILHGFSGDTDGIDIAAPVGVAVHAAADGDCIYAGEELQTYGKLVLIRHANGFVTAYAVNSELEVKEGDKIRRGQIIAKSGVSGNVPHLHFELRKDGKPIDPTKFLVPL